MDFNGEKCFSSNLLLLGLSADDQELLRPHLIRTEISPGMLLDQKNAEIQKVHFIERGLVAAMARLPDRAACGVGLIGRGGMTGGLTIIGVNRTPFDKRVIIAGTALSIDCEPLAEAMMNSSTLRSRFLCFHHANALLMIQMCIAKAHGNAQMGLACLLLMAHDGVDGDVLELTHETIGLFLGVRRATVTVALHEIEALGLIRSTRGLVTIRDREGLQHLAGDFYGTAEAEYARLLL